MAQSTTSTTAANGRARAELPLSKGWVQGIALVMIFGFTVMGMLAARTYTDSMPQPEQVVGPAGEVHYERRHHRRPADLPAPGPAAVRLDHGSRAYLGPDYTAEYLRLSTEHVKEALTTAGEQDPTQRVVEIFRTNTYDEATGTVTFTAEQVAAFEAIKEHYADFFGTRPPSTGCSPTRSPTPPRSTN